MVVVTGIPRSGTSAIMQTLKLLGVPVAGKKFPSHEIPELNPKGFYELDSVTLMQGVRHNRFSGMAVKLVGPGLVGTSRDLISKVIVSERGHLPCQESLFYALRKFGYDITIGQAVLAYDICEDIINYFLKGNGIPVLKVRLEDLVKNPEEEVGKIAEFIGIETDITKAVKNIDRRR